ncbi:MAG: hypothetical protein M3N32_09710 [Actinomycetota bacterium]|nr:hypothetical protein [Actinomycetota bacterium]
MGVADAIVLVAVVHEHVGLTDLDGEILERVHPSPQLVLVVEVPETLRRGDSLPLPVVSVAAVEPHERELCRRGCDDGRDRRLEALRLIDADIGQRVLLQQLEGSVAVAFGEPRPVTELDGDPVVGEPVSQCLEVLAVGPLRREPRRPLEDHSAEPAGIVQGSQRAIEPRPGLVDQLSGQVPHVDARLVLVLDRDLPAQVLP